MSVLVRPVRPEEDAAALARIWRETGRFFAGLNPDAGREPDPHGLVEWTREVHQKFAEDPEVLAVAAEVDGEVAGMLTARLSEPAASAHWQVLSDFGRRRVHIDALGVAEAYRRSGVGTALMTAAEEWAVDRGAEVITLETDLKNPTSMPFYERRMGFSQQEVQFRKVLGPR